MFDGPLMLWVNLPVVDTIHPQSNKFVMGVKIKATGESKLNDRPDYTYICHRMKITYNVVPLGKWKPLDKSCQGYLIDK